MSSRQLRRLQNLVKASTGADDDDDESFPSTMKAPKNSKKSKGNRKTINQELQVDNNKKVQYLEGQQELKKPQQQEGEKQKTVSNHTDKEMKKKKTGDEKEKSPLLPSNSMKEIHLEDNNNNDNNILLDKHEVISEIQKKKQRNKNKKAKRREVEREEELLLEAVLKEREGGVDGNLHNSGEIENEEMDLLSILSRCNPKMLDSRQELISRFGVGAVEDVGDGKVPQRKAENRPSSLLFPDHPNYKPRFRHSLLATPNRYCWPPFDGLGCLLAVKKTKENNNKNNNNNNSENSPLIYYLDTSAPETRRADFALAMCESQHGGLEGLMECLGKAPYHIPTIILLSSVFETIGNIPRAQEALDLALYHVGVLFSRFPLRQTVHRRRLPFSIRSNRQIFQILRSGVHQALKKAATRTAWEIAKLIYSLDDTDPFGMLLLIDYLALRAKRWSWLLQIYFVMRYELNRKISDKFFKNKNEVNNMWNNHNLALALSTLPGFFFSAALAQFFIEREEISRVSEGGESGVSKPSKIIRDMTPGQIRALRNIPSASIILADAIGKFPSAAVMLVEKLGGEESVIGSAPIPWRNIVNAHETFINSNTTQDQSFHVAELWVARIAEMWKAAEPRAFLKNIITEENGSWLTKYSLPALNDTISDKEKGIIYPTPWQYGSLKEEDILDRTIATIPENLLNPDEFTEEDMMDQLRHVTQRELTPLEENALLRFRALYGPLPGNLSSMEQLSRYSAMFDQDGVEQRIGEEYNPISLFLHTLLPWNSTRDMALRAALEAAGVRDPVAERNLRRREEDAVIWMREEEEESWETEESWSVDEYIGADSEEENEGNA